MAASMSTIIKHLVLQKVGNLLSEVRPNSQKALRCVGFS
jgi:hypothetical protein